MKLEVQMIEAAKGWQAETSITATWTAYTKVMPTIEQVEKEIEKLAKMLSADFVYI